MTQPTVQIVHADLLATVAELRDVLSSLESERRASDRTVDVLLDGGWSGRAAASFLEGWDDWRTGCDAVLGALRTMADLVAAARAEQVEQDQAAEAALRSLASALLEKIS